MNSIIENVNNLICERPFILKVIFSENYSFYHYMTWDIYYKVCDNIKFNIIQISLGRSIFNEFDYNKGDYTKSISAKYYYEYFLPILKKIY